MIQADGLKVTSKTPVQQQSLNSPLMFSIKQEAHAEPYLSLGLDLSSQRTKAP